MSNSEYFTLGQSYKEGDLYIKDVDYDRKVIQKLINKGRKINIEFDVTISLKSKKCNYIDFPMSITVLDFVSDSFKELLETYTQDMKYLEFFPVKIEGVEKPKQNYWVVNILDNIKCFDWEDSKYSRFPDNDSFRELQDRPDNIFELKIKKENINDRNIFRMYEAPTSIFVSSFLKKKIEEECLTGIVFNSLEKFIR